MKKLLGIFAVGLAGLALVQVPTARRSPADLVPPGPLLVLEARDFSTVLRDWNASPEKQRWLESDNFAVFSRSRLYLRLQQAHTEFTQAAGFPASMAVVESVAGAESALALYDIGKLEFLYITRMPAGRAAETVLWQSRGSFEPRNAAGQAFYVRVDPQSRRVAAFAAAGDFLLLATREDLLAGALTLLAGRSEASVKSERWYDQPARAAAAPGDLRLVMNLAALIRSPHFRSYWIQENVSDLRQYWAGISDAHRSAAEIREERVFLRSNDAGAAGEEGSAELLRLVPDDAGLYRLRTRPSAEQVVELLERKILAPRIAPGPASRIAPVVPVSGEAGVEADLETRIDEPPLANARGAFAPAALRKLLEAAGVQAVLQLDASRPISDGVFIGTESAVVLLAPSDWNGDAVRSALLEAIQTLWTTSRLGLQWVDRGGYQELDGPAGVAFAARGRLLVVANGAGLLNAVLAKLPSPPAAQRASYAAGFRLAREREPFARMMAMIDYPAAATAPGPRFFSGNLAGLGQVLGRVDSASIVVHDRGPQVTQTVVYRFRP